MPINRDAGLKWQCNYHNMTRETKYKFPKHKNLTGRRRRRRASHDNSSFFFKKTDELKIRDLEVTMVTCALVKIMMDISHKGWAYSMLIHEHCLHGFSKPNDVLVLYKNNQFYHVLKQILHNHMYCPLSLRYTNFYQICYNIEYKVI